MWRRLKAFFWLLVNFILWILVFVYRVTVVSYVSRVLQFNNNSPACCELYGNWFLVVGMLFWHCLFFVLGHCFMAKPALLEMFKTQWWCSCSRMRCYFWCCWNSAIFSEIFLWWSYTLSLLMGFLRTQVIGGWRLVDCFCVSGDGWGP